MFSIATHTIVWLPGILVWPSLITILPRFLPPFAYDWTPADQEFWQSREPEVVIAFVLKDVVERPYPLTWVLLIIAGVVAVVCTKSSLRKSVLFYTMFITLFATRCMGTFSGLQHIKTLPAFWLQQLPWDSASFFKGFFLSWMIEQPFWDYSYLSLYANNTSTPDEAPVVSVDTNNDDKTQTPRQIDFRDAMIRLAYYHVIDSALHMIWLRYFWSFGEGEPYTAYLNNSELLSILLAMQMIGWSCYRVCETYMIPKQDIEKGSN
jgi:hypothetical protein